jgi:polysaccharide export outer membrane protein
MVRSLLFVALSVSALSPRAWAQVADRPEKVPPAIVAPERPGGGDYRLGPDDQVAISVLQAPELSATVRVSDEGSISLPLLGAVRASGLTASQLERSIEEQLARKYMKNPDAIVEITDIRSHPVSVVGAVNRPGVVQVRGSTTLLEVLTLAGGLNADAGETAVVLRNGTAGAAPVEVKLRGLMESRDPSLNVPIYPGDVINVRAADIVYVAGAVNKPGAYAMRGNERLTVLRAIALSEGLTRVASTKDALVVRTGPGGSRVEIPVDLPALLKGKHGDVALEAHDILFVPTSEGKVAARATLDALVHVLSWRIY